MSSEEPTAMTTQPAPSAPRLLTADEVAACIRLFRDLRHWSQEQLAAISGLNVRTIQRVEQGESASFDTRRALARAFELEDIDALNKPFAIPNEDELRAAKEKFDREHITLGLSPLTTGRQLAQLVESCEMDLSEPAFELELEAAEVFAAMVDAFREYRDCAELYTQVQKLDVHEEFQRHIDELKKMGVSLRYAERNMQMRAGAPDATPLRMTALYIVAFRLGKEPDQIATPRAARIGC
jgi:transcriptional regulator with XRE-family HTH domain